MTKWTFSQVLIMFMTDLLTWKNYLTDIPLKRQLFYIFIWTVEILHFISKGQFLLPNCKAHLILPAWAEVLYVTQHIKRYQLSEDLILSYRGAKSSKYGFMVNFEMSHILESSIRYFSSCLKDLMQTLCFHVKMDFCNCLCHVVCLYFAQIPKLLRAFF